MTKQDYNGWTNYETWVVKLWMDNDEASQNHWSEQAEQAIEHAKGYTERKLSLDRLRTFHI